MTFEGYAIRGQLREATAPTTARRQPQRRRSVAIPAIAELRRGRSAGGGRRVLSGPARGNRPHARRVLAPEPAETAGRGPPPWSRTPAGCIPARLAAAVLRRVKIPPQVIVLCPRHDAGGAEWAVAPYRPMADSRRRGRRPTANWPGNWPRRRGPATRRPAARAGTCHRGAVAAVGPAGAAGARGGHHDRHAGELPSLQRFAAQLAGVSADCASGRCC